MLTKELELTNQGGLHARPAAFFVQLCNTFKSSIKVALGGRQADAKSVIGVMILGAGKGKTVTLTIEGEDESLAMEKISEYFANLE
jgi:phosphotransferase system HPr (HPr) family protein